MAFVDHQKEILGEEIDQTEGPLARLSAGQVPRVVFDSIAKSHLLEHLEIVLAAHADPLRLQIPAVALEPGNALLPFRFDASDRRLQFSPARHVLVRWIEVELLELPDDGSSDRLEFADAIHLVAEEFHPQPLLQVGGHHVDDITSHAEASPLQFFVVTVVDVVDQPLQKDVASQFHPALEADAKP